MKWVHFRWACPKFLRQSFHEWAGHSIAYSAWACAYYQQQRKRGKGHHAAVRALAFKWIRVVFRCWKDRVAHDENKYLAALAQRGSPLSVVLAQGKTGSAASQVRNGSVCTTSIAGRKTDVKDAEWIADLLCHGLLRSSFVPPQPIRELRELTRYRRKLVESQSAERNRLQKLLETANIKLSSVASDVFGVSGRLMLKALAKGEATPQAMAELAKRSLRSKIPQLELALEGRMEEHHRFLLRMQLDRLEAVEHDLTVLEQRLQEKLKPYAVQLALLDEIPGVDWTLAAVIIAELGVDMSVFQNVSQLASWAGVCPGNNESAGKRKSSRIPKGNVYLKTALVEAANSAAKTKGTYLRDKFYRLKARRGYKRAAVAIAHKILVATYHMLSRQVSYHDLGDLYLDKLNKHHLTRNLVHRLERLGYTVTLTLERKAA